MPAALRAESGVRASHVTLVTLWASKRRIGFVIPSQASNQSLCGIVPSGFQMPRAFSITEDGQTRIIIPARQHLWLKAKGGRQLSAHYQRVLISQSRQVSPAGRAH